MMQQELSARIAELVVQHWKGKKIPILLSDLGTRHSGDIGRSAKVIAGGLEKYIAANFEDRIRIVSHGDNPLVKWALPWDVDIQALGGVDNLLGRARSRSVGSGPHYVPAFWAAFRKPLDASSKRFLHIKDKVWFEDNVSDLSGDGVVEVRSDFVAKEDDDVSVVLEHISQWLKENNMKEGQFVVGDKADKSSRSTTDNLLARVLDQLDDVDLARISIPLDIAKKLRNMEV